MDDFGNGILIRGDSEAASTPVPKLPTFRQAEVCLCSSLSGGLMANFGRTLFSLQMLKNVDAQHGNLLNALKMAR